MRLERIGVFVCAAAMLVAVGCGDDKSPDDMDMGGDTTFVSKLQIVKGENGPDYPDAMLTVTTPGPDEVVNGDSVMVSVSLTGVDLGAPTKGENSKGLAYSKDGQHIHVIIDDKPYMAMYNAENFSVGPLSEGAHTLRAFPSRSWHESIKTPGAFVYHTFYVKTKSGEPELKADAPLLTYSRPKGEYKDADAKRVLLDFYLANAELGADKYKVVASVDGSVLDTLTEWMPYYIEGLKDGKHKIGLELIGPDNQPVANGSFNKVEREITITSKSATAKKEDGADLEKDMLDAGRHSMP